LRAIFPIEDEKPGFIGRIFSFLEVFWFEFPSYSRIFLTVPPFNKDFGLFPSLDLFVLVFSQSPQVFVE